MDGETRIYAMPFTNDGIMMWQLSFPISIEDAQQLNRAGSVALLAEARRRCSKWHSPIDQLMNDTKSEDVTGYPTFDRPSPEANDLQLFSNHSSNNEIVNDSNNNNNNNNIVLIGDSVHPMSPFKGQGANQALIDGHQLAICLSKNDNIKSSIDEFWKKMIQRVRSKVNGSAKAAIILHSKDALVEGNVTRATAHKSASNK